MDGKQKSDAVVTLLLTSAVYFLVYYLVVYPRRKTADEQGWFMSAWHFALGLWMAGGVALTFILASSADGEQQLALLTSLIFYVVYFCCNEIGITILRQSLTKPLPDLGPFPEDVMLTYQRRMEGRGFDPGVTVRI